MHRAWHDFLRFIFIKRSRLSRLRTKISGSETDATGARARAVVACADPMETRLDGIPVTSLSSIACHRHLDGNNGFKQQGHHLGVEKIHREDGRVIKIGWEHAQLDKGVGHQFAAHKSGTGSRAEFSDSRTHRSTDLAQESGDKIGRMFGIGFAEIGFQNFANPFLVIQLVDRVSVVPRGTWKFCFPGPRIGCVCRVY